MIVVTNTRRGHNEYKKDAHTKHRKQKQTKGNSKGKGNKTNHGRFEKDELSQGKLV